MGKIARIVVVTIGLIASLFGQSDPWVTEHGDQQAKAERALALLGSLGLGILMIVGTGTYDQLVSPIDPSLFIGLILLSVPASIVPYVLLDRHISQLERERAEAAPKLTTKS